MSMQGEYNGDGDREVGCVWIANALFSIQEVKPPEVKPSETGGLIYNYTQI